MWIVPDPDTDNGEGGGGGGARPLFQIQSIDFDPNIRLLPGLPNVSPASLGVEIEVVGELRPSTDGRGVTGRIGFCSGGKLPPPMRLLPSGVLRGAGRVICDTVSRFVLREFEKGAVGNFREYCREQEDRMED